MCDVVGDGTLPWILPNTDVLESFTADDVFYDEDGNAQWVRQRQHLVTAYKDFNDVTRAFWRLATEILPWYEVDVVPTYGRYTRKGWSYHGAITEVANVGDPGNWMWHIVLTAALELRRALGYQELWWLNSLGMEAAGDVFESILGLDVLYPDEGYHRYRNPVEVATVHVMGQFAGVWLAPSRPQALSATLWHVVAADVRRRWLEKKGALDVLRLGFRLVLPSVKYAIFHISLRESRRQPRLQHWQHRHPHHHEQLYITKL